MSGGAQTQAASGGAGGSSLAAVAPILATLMKQPQGGAGAAPMAHPMMGPGGAQPLTPMPAPPMSGAPMGAGGGLLGGMGGMPQPGMQSPQLQQLLMQRGLLGGMGGGRPY